MGNLYDQIEEPLKELVKLLRDNGFDTECSCGHLPNPYIQIAMNEGSDIDRAYNLLVNNGYKDFEIQALWSFMPYDRRKYFDIRFNPKHEVLADISDIKNEDKSLS